MKTYQCIVCGFIYDESVGMPEDGIAAGANADRLITMPRQSGGQLLDDGRIGMGHDSPVDAGGCGCIQQSLNHLAGAAVGRVAAADSKRAGGFKGKFG